MFYTEITQQIPVLNYFIIIGKLFLWDCGRSQIIPGITGFKDGAYFCYKAYVLRTSRYSGFLWVVPRDIFARFKTMRKKQNLGNALGIQKENWG